MNSTAKIYLALQQWIELTRHPLYEMRDDTSDIQHRLETVSKKSQLIPNELLDINIWGGMGSFIDNAGLDTFAVPPKGNDPKAREAQWQAIITQEDKWNRSFNEATITLGNALIDWCDENKVHLEPWQFEMIVSWVKFAKLNNDHPFEPLNPENILTLEHNLNLHEA